MGRRFYRALLKNDTKKGYTRMNRDKIIIRTSIIGIITNIFLAAFKAIIGLLANSIAIILDAVNNLSDALSSVITIVGTKLASKTPDHKHPMGYGRIEYLSAMAVSGIVLYAGITSLVESIKKIIHPQKATYTHITLIIIAVAIVAKIVLGLFVKSRGKKVKSAALVASGSDALFDAILSASVLASAALYMFTGIGIEAYIGLLISAIIIKSGFEMLMETLNDILGKRVDGDLSINIKKILASEPEIRGAYDLFISNFGPDKDYASVHVEVPDTMTVAELDVLSRRAAEKVFDETGVVITGMSVYSYNTQDDEAAHLRDEIRKLVVSHEWALQMHGFYLDEETKQIRFDVVKKFGYDAETVFGELYKELQEKYPEYNFHISPDYDISD